MFGIWEPLVWFFVITALLVSPLLPLVVLGICFAPFAACISAIVARHQKRSVLQSFGGGFVASALLFLPWLCLLAKNIRWRHTTGLLRFTYVLTLIGWGISVGVLIFVAFMWTIGFLIGLTNRDGIFSDAFAPYSPLLLVAYAFVAFSVWVWRWEQRSVSQAIRDHEQHWPSAATFVPLRFIEPFLFASLWVVGGPPLLLGVGYAWLNFALKY